MGGGGGTSLLKQHKLADFRFCCIYEIEYLGSETERAFCFKSA